MISPISAAVNNSAFPNNSPLPPLKQPDKSGLGFKELLEAEEKLYREQQKISMEVKNYGCLETVD